MSNVFKSAASRFKDSRLVIIITFICIIGIAVSFAAFISDYKSSYKGYVALPTEKVSEIVWLIALLPQVGQVIFGTLFTLTFERDQGQTRVNWLKAIPYGAITLFLLAFDLGTDVWFKTRGLEDGLWSLLTLIALIESITVYTIGSEVLLIASSGLFLYALPLTLRQIEMLVKELSGNDDSPQVRR